MRDINSCVAAESPAKKSKFIDADYESHWKVYLQSIVEALKDSSNRSVVLQEFQKKLTSYIENCIGFYQNEFNHKKNHEDLHDKDPRALSICEAVLETYSSALKVLQGKPQEGIEGFLRAINLSSSFGLAHLWLLATYYHESDYDNIISHFEAYNLMNFDIGCHYTDALYQHLHLFSIEEIQEHHIHFAHPYFQWSEVFFYYIHAKKKRGFQLSDEMSQLYLWRGDQCLFNNNILAAIWNYQKSCELNNNNLSSQVGKALCSILLGDYKVALDQSMPEILALPNLDNQKISILQVASQLCLQFRNPSRARFLMSKINFQALAGRERMEYYKLELLLLLHDDHPYWPLLLEKFTRFAESFQSLDISDQDHSEALETFMSLLNQCVARYFRLEDFSNTINATHLALKFYDEGLVYLEGLLEPKPQSVFPTRCHDRVYLRYFNALIKLYTYFPRVGALHPLILTKDEILRRVNLISKKLSAYSVPVSDTVFAPGVRGLLEHMVKICQIAQLVTEEDFELIHFINKKFLGVQETISQDEPLEVIEESSEEEVPKVDEFSLFEIFHLFYSEIIDMLAAKENSAKPFDRVQHAEQLMESKAMAANETVEYCFSALEHKMLKLNVRAAADFSPSLARSLLECFLEINTQTSRMDEALQAGRGEALVLIYLRENLIEKCQSFYFRFLTDMNRLLVNFFANRDLETPKMVFEAYSQWSLIAYLACNLDRYHNEHSTLMSVKIRAAVNTFMELRDQFGKMQNNFLKQKLRMEQSSQLSHPLDVHCQTNETSYRVPFPSQLLGESIKKVLDVIKKSKNLSAHVLTLVFSIPAANDAELASLMHLHLPLRLSECPENQLTGISELEKEIPGIQNNILKRIGQGNLIASQHQESGIIPDKSPNEFDAIKHMHSEQYFYAWLSQQKPAAILNKIHQLPGGNLFRSGVSVLMLSLDMISTRGSCHPCRLSALATQNCKDEFVGVFSSFLREAGFHTGNTILTCVTRVLAMKENKMDTPDKKHKNPKEREIRGGDMFKIYQEIQPSVYVSGASHNAFK